MTAKEEFRIVVPATMGARVIQRSAELGLDIHQFTLIAWENQLASAELNNDSTTISKHLTLTTYATEEITPWTGLRAADLSGIEPVLGEPVHLDKDRILWGQFNRFLPIKLTLRSLLAEGNGEPVKLDEWQHPVRSHSATWRKHLRAIDERLRIRRGSQLASGFPKSEEKSLNRFIDHFTAVIRGTQSGSIAGMPAEMGFIEVDPQDHTVRLTLDGFEYAMLENPIIDVGGDTKVPMSDAERAWMETHIVSHLPKEHRFMSNILREIDNGHDTPTTLVEQMLNSYGPNSGRGWSKEQVSTYQGGALARMGCLGFIGRRWEYRRVHYELTENGKAFIKDVI